MKGIILAAGRGSRLFPLTSICNKELLPVFDKPMVYYPLTNLMMSGIREILIITSPRDKPLFERLLQDGSQLGISIEYAVQQQPRGIADAFIIGERFIGSDHVCLILGDNIFCGPGIYQDIKNSQLVQPGAVIFGYYVENPRRFGVVELDSKGCPVSLEEKPLYPKSNYAVPGLYFYDQRVVSIAKAINPSERGELEITDVNRIYLGDRELTVKILSCDTLWLDAGTPESLLSACNQVYNREATLGKKIGCPEEAAFLQGYISCEQLFNLAQPFVKTDYGQYLMRIARKALPV